MREISQFGHSCLICYFRHPYPTGSLLLGIIEKDRHRLASRIRRGGGRGWHYGRSSGLAKTLWTKAARPAGPPLGQTCGPLAADLYLSEVHVN